MHTHTHIYIYTHTYIQESQNKNLRMENHILRFEAMIDYFCLCIYILKTIFKAHPFRVEIFFPIICYKQNTLKK